MKIEEDSPPIKKVGNSDLSTENLGWEDMEINAYRVKMRNLSQESENRRRERAARAAGLA